MSETVRAGRRSVRVTNLDKVLFPEDGITKGDLVDYYRRIAPVMLPHVRARPLSMERFPDGIHAGRIFQKNASKYFPEWIPRATVPKKGGTVTHPLTNDAAALVYLANQACVAFHTWLSTIRAPDRPDVLVFDLDPGPNGFETARRGALILRDEMDREGLAPFVKTSGSKGLHVVVPLRPARGFDEVHAFAVAVARRLIAREPDAFTLEFFKADRKGRLLVDVNRNAYAQTAVAPYSVRALRGAPVAVPLRWDEVADESLRPGSFSMQEALARAAGDDPWHGFRSAARALPRPRREGRGG